MNYAELLGLSPAFGLDKPIDGSVDSTPSSERKSVLPASTSSPVTFNQDQLRLLAAMGQTGSQNQMRTPGAVAPHTPAMLPMAQIALPQQQGPGARPGLSQLIYGH